MNIFFKILCFLFFLLKTTYSFSEDTKIKIGVLAPLSGENSALGKQIISSIRMALIDINDDKIEKMSEKEMCKTDDFVLSPHQEFVKIFIHYNTPYNGLLLFHGLGTGKTCSSIQVCEEVRKNHTQMGMNKKIFVVASPAVQENYKRQLTGLSYNLNIPYVYSKSTSASSSLASNSDISDSICLIS